MNNQKVLTINESTYMLTDGTNDTLFIREEDCYHLTPEWMGDVASYSQINTLLLNEEGIEELVIVKAGDETWEEDVLSIRVGRIYSLTGRWCSIPAEALAALSRLEIEEPES